MRRIHTLFAVGASSLLLVLALAPAALAAGTVGARTGGRALAVPNSNLKGSPAHFSPSRLSAKARWTSTTCTLSQASFMISNLKKVTEKVNLTATGVTGRASLKIPARRREVLCIRKGYVGTLHVALADGKKLTVNF